MDGLLVCRSLSDRNCSLSSGKGKAQKGGDVTKKTKTQEGGEITEMGFFKRKLLSFKEQQAAHRPVASWRSLSLKQLCRRSASGLSLVPSTKVKEALE